MSLEDKLLKMKVDLKSAKKEQGRLDDIDTDAKVKVAMLEAEKVKLWADVPNLMDENEVLSAEVTELKASLGRSRRGSSYVLVIIFGSVGMNRWGGYLEGKHTSWNPQGNIDNFNQAFPGEYVPLEPRMTRTTLRWDPLLLAPMPMSRWH